MPDRVVHPRGSLSISYKLPLIMCGLVVLVVFVIGTASYLQIRGLTTRSATARAQTVAQDIAELLQAGVVRLSAQVDTLAADPRLLAYARTRNASDRAGALEALSNTWTQPQQVLGATLLDSNGSVLLAGNTSTADSLHLNVATLGQVGSATSTHVRRMRALNGNVVYPVVAQMAGTGLRVVEWRRFVGTASSRDQIKRLIGSDATVLLANADHSLKADLSGQIITPVAGAQIISAERPIRGTPWMAQVEFPRSLVLAPVGTFLRWLLLFSLICIGIALVTAWLASRRIIAPLQQLRTAADAIAQGDFGRRVVMRRRDEFGAVAGAFNTMADEIAGSQHRLEERVKERTSELNDALDQLRDAQDALVRREKLALIGQLASSVGHELRNPLGVMNNAAYYLSAVLTSAPPKVHEYLGILTDQIRLSERIVSDLLDFARIKEPQREAASMRQIVTTQLQRAGVPADVTVDVDIPDDLPAANIDPLQIGQVVLNLIVNAAQAMNGGGTLTIRARTHDGNRVALDVSDTGSGIAPENMERIFEALFTTKARGIGLGLAVSRGLARANGGEITVESTPGQGAKFSLDLPAVTEVAFA